MSSGNRISYSDDFPLLSCDSFDHGTRLAPTLYRDPTRMCSLLLTFDLNTGANISVACYHF